MIIKNLDCNFNYINNPYSGKKPDKTNAASANTESAFSNSLNRASSASKVDTFELSQHTADSAQTITETKDKILSDLNKDKDEQYISRIKEQLNNKQYAVNPIEIAKIMLTDSNK